MIEGQAIVPAPEKHSFRGEYLDCFAVIENHLAPVVKRLVELGQAKRAPLLFGLKFDLVLKSIHAEEVWQHREHVAPILEELSQFAAMRGSICHGLMHEASIGGQPALSITPPGSKSWTERKVLTAQECAAMIRALRQLTERLLKQGMKQATKPTS